MINRIGVFSALTILAAVVTVSRWGGQVHAAFSLKEERLLRTFTEVLHTTQTKYALPVSSQELVESAIRGMLRTLDPHSSFFSTTDYNRLQEEQQGKYYGLGITIRPEAPGSGRVVIVEPPAPGTPAYKVGLRAGDVISKIEGKPIEDWDINREVIPNLKGPRGTIVRITVDRAEEFEPINFTIERDAIPLYTIKFVVEIRPRIGYLRINKFSETTHKELGEALDELDEASLEGLILDLRDNPGGSLSQAIAVADRFLEKGQLIVSTRNQRKHRAEHQPKGREHRAPEGRRYYYPMIVLINGNSASASEIVAGALQDHDRALIVGETSFGKALVQTIYPLDGSKGLALTTGKYYTPSDRLIQRDYSESFYEYMYRRAKTEGLKREEYRTDRGRVVYGGGGITPDEVVRPESTSKLVRLIKRKNLFYEFIIKLTTGAISSASEYPEWREQWEDLKAEQQERIRQQLTVSESVLGEFKAFLNAKGVKFTDPSFDEDRKSIRNGLQRELFLKLLGEREGFKVSLEVDHQLQRAIEFLPRAKFLSRVNTRDKFRVVLRMSESISLAGCRT